MIDSLSGAGFDPALPDERTPISAPVSGVLFTAFEPSGDDHASVVIAELRRRHPDLPIHAWGGPKMQAAGATIVERTGDDAVMGLPGPKKIAEHLAVNRRVAEFLDRTKIVVHVPVDSPAANTPLASIARSRGVRVVNLVAPQYWAWGPWRAAKLRRVSDMVLCVLPFEEAWFTNARIPARFIGHTIFDRTLDLAELDRAAETYGRGSPRLALMPGSRPKEIDRNWGVLLRAYRRIEREMPGTCGMVAATTPAVERDLRRRAESLGGWPASLGVASGATDAIVRWCDLALVVSGTVTLQISRQIRPMVILYKSSRLFYHAVGRWLLSTELFTLPNLIAGRAIVPEFVPYFGAGDEIADAALRILRDPAVAERQRRDLTDVVVKFRGLSASRAAADAIEHAAGLVPVAADHPAPGAGGSQGRSVVPGGVQPA